MTRVKTRGFIEIGSLKIKAPKLTRKQMLMKTKSIVFTEGEFKKARERGEVF